MCSYVEYEGCPENIQPFWISREPVAWPWCNLAASQMRPYCASVNSHSPVGLVSRQWDAVDWACVLCDRHIHNDRSRRSASSRQCACPFYSSRAGLFIYFFIYFFIFFFFAKHHITQVFQPYLAPCDFWLFPEPKSPIQMEDIYACDGHIVYKLSQRRLTADWLAPRESGCSRMHSNVPADWLPSHIKATRPVL